MIRVYPPSEQGRGAFDGGRITENKPIGFAGEGSAVDRVGALFYWAWASAREHALIGMHPHQGFEIISYVLRGEIGHRDSRGEGSETTAQTVGSGGLQAMQTGSGISHEEELAEGTEMFQIWFEPDLRQALRREPTYLAVEADQFSVQSEGGVTKKPLVGDGAPVELAAPVSAQDVTIEAGCEHQVSLEAGEALACVVVSGGGAVSEGAELAGTPVRREDFVVIDTPVDSKIRLRGDDAGALRVVFVRTPREPGYSLLRK